MVHLLHRGVRLAEGMPALIEPAGVTDLRD